MKLLRTVLLMPKQVGCDVIAIADQAGISLEVLIVEDKESLELAFSTKQDLLLSFGTTVIVPHWIIRSPGLTALNIHAASPQYPGRDSHHFAVYDGVRQYGATMHYMTEDVDAGSIVDVELFDTPSYIQPFELLRLANEAGWLLIKRFFKKYIINGAPHPLDGVRWGTRRTTRKMFLDLCRIEPSTEEAEIARRAIATAMPGYRNLFIDIGGYRFRIEGPII